MALPRWVFPNEQNFKKSVRGSAGKPRLGCSLSGRRPTSLDMVRGGAGDAFGHFALWHRRQFQEISGCQYVPPRRPPVSKTGSE